MLLDESSVRPGRTVDVKGERHIDCMALSVETLVKSPLVNDLPGNYPCSLFGNVSDNAMI